MCEGIPRRKFTNSDTQGISFVNKSAVSYHRGRYFYIYDPKIIGCCWYWDIYRSLVVGFCHNFATLGHNTLSSSQYTYQARQYGIFKVTRRGKLFIYKITFAINLPRRLQLRNLTTETIFSRSGAGQVIINQQLYFQFG